MVVNNETRRETARRSGSRAVELLGQGIERITSREYRCSTRASLLLRLAQNWRSQVGYFCTQPSQASRVSLHTVVSLTVMMVAERGSPDKSAISPNQSCGPRTAMLSLLPPPPSRALDRPRLDKIEGIALIPLGKDRRSGGKNFFFEPAKNFSYILARESGKQGHGRPYPLSRP